MSNPATTTYNNRDPNYKNICNAYGCNSPATEEIELDVGKYGKMTFSVCERCIGKFERCKQDLDTRRDQSLQSPSDFVGNIDKVKRESGFKPQFTTVDNLSYKKEFLQ